MTASTNHLIAPHGGELIQLQVPAERAAELKAQSKDWPSWDLTARQLCDLELLMLLDPSGPHPNPPRLAGEGIQGPTKAFVRICG